MLRFVFFTVENSEGEFDVIDLNEIWMSSGLLFPPAYYFNLIMCSIHFLYIKHMVNRKSLNMSRSMIVWSKLIF